MAEGEAIDDALHRDGARMRTGHPTKTKFMSANLPPGPFGKSFTDLLASPALTVLRMAALAASQDDGIDERDPPLARVQGYRSEGGISIRA